MAQSVAMDKLYTGDLHWTYICSGKLWEGNSLVEPATLLDEANVPF